MAAQPVKGSKGDGDKPLDLILGTAGHIDHGKSSLVLAMTGTDPDRLQEEKDRGITIELGFARLVLPSGRTMGVVDVPGHERFVRQMIAGSTGVDLALLVIAADDGIMPQTVEHLAVLETLGVPGLVVALTKRDLVDAEWLEFITGEVAGFLASTPYADAPIVPVSSRTGEGVEELKTVIDKACAGIARDRQGKSVRYPIDRVFTIKGTGTVVTGTLWSGTVKTDDVLEILPSGKRCRVRSIQIHNEPCDTAQAGNRVAMALNGVGTEEVRPGDFIATPESITPTLRFDAYLTYRDTAKTGKPLESGTRMHVAHGTKEVTGRVLLTGGTERLHPGEGGYAQIRLDEPLPVSYRDRFIIRSYSPVHVTGGGMVLLAHPRHSTMLSDEEQALIEALREGKRPSAVASALKLSPLPVSAGELASGIGLDPEETADILDASVSAGDAVRLGSEGADGTGTGSSAPGTVAFYTTRGNHQRLESAVERALIDYHAKNPNSPGLPEDDLRRLINERIDPRAFSALVDDAAKAGSALRIPGGIVGHPSAQSSVQAASTEAADALVEMLRDAGTTPPSVPELAKAAGLETSFARRTLSSLAEAGRVCRISGELYFEQGVADRMTEAVRQHLAAGGDGTVATLREVMGTSRKFAVPFLEHLDATRVTKRVGDERELIG